MHLLLSNDYPTCSELAESYNEFLVGLTAQFEALISSEGSESLEPPGHILFGEREVCPALRCLKTSKSHGPDVIPNNLLKIFPLFCQFFADFRKGFVFIAELENLEVYPVIV